MPKTVVPFSEMSDDAFIRQAELLAGILPISPASLWRKVKNGSFPRPVKLGPKTTAWRVGSVRAWLEAQA
jgi:predicted DNA-binding transcriptional regulator AlpA